MPEHRVSVPEIRLPEETVLLQQRIFSRHAVDDDVEASEDEGDAGAIARNRVSWASFSVFASRPAGGGSPSATTWPVTPSAVNPKRRPSWCSWRCARSTA